MIYKVPGGDKSMSSTYRFVKLLKNHLYPTYQLHAFMANDKTDPKDGLQLAAIRAIFRSLLPHDR